MPFADARVATRGTPSVPAGGSQRLLQESLKDLTLATPPPAVQMLIARKEMELHPVDVFKTTLVTHTLHVDLSVPSMRTAPLTRHAQDFTVWTPAPASVVPTPNAESSTTSPPAPVTRVTKETPSHLADCGQYPLSRWFRKTPVNPIHVVQTACLPEMMVAIAAVTAWLK